MEYIESNVMEIIRMKEEEADRGNFEVGRCVAIYANSIPPADHCLFFPTKVDRNDIY